MDVTFRVILEIKVEKPEEAPPVDVKLKVTEVIVVKVKENKGKIGKFKIDPNSVRSKGNTRDSHISYKFWVTLCDLCLLCSISRPVIFYRVSRNVTIV